MLDLDHNPNTESPMSLPDTLPDKSRESLTRESPEDTAAAVTPDKNAGHVTFLAQLPPDTFLTVAALANGFGCSARTIRRWMRARILPPWDRGLKMWRVANILTWLENRVKLKEKAAWDYLVRLEAMEK